MSGSCNLLLVAFDTTRADHLSCYGYRRRTTPNVDRRLANRGAVFLNHFAPSNCTLPGYTTIFTGLFPTSHGVVAHGATWAPHPSARTLAEVLSSKGWKTAAVTTLVEMNCEVGQFRRGFGSWRFDSPENRAKYAAALIGWEASGGLQYQGGHVVPAPRVAAQATDLLEQLGRERKRGGPPFFLFVHFWDPHSPYVPPAEFDAYYDKPVEHARDPGNVALRQAYACPTGRWLREVAKFDDRYRDVTDPDYFVALYDGEIAHADHHLGVLLDHLEGLGLEGETVVALTSDHGEVLDEPNALIQGTRANFSHVGLTDPACHIPLVVAGPGVPARRVEQLTTHADLAPTLLDALGVTGPPGSPDFASVRLAPKPFDGVSLLPFLLGREPVVRASACELGTAPEDPQAPNEPVARRAVLLLENTYQKARALRTRRWKYVKALPTGGRPATLPPVQLFDLYRDPGELQNVAEAAPGVCRVLDALLEAWVVALCNKFERRVDPQLEHGTTLGVFGDQFEYAFLSENAEPRLLLVDAEEDWQG
ncbi:MAG: sulfatase [Promethearchaeota archaeon]